MRTFTLGSGTDRKFVVIEVEGPRMRMIQGDAEGKNRRKEKVLGSEAEARAAAEKLAREMLARGYVEKGAAVVKNGRPVASLSKSARPVGRSRRRRRGQVRLRRPRTRRGRGTRPPPQSLRAAGPRRRPQEEGRQEEEAEGRPERRQPG